MLGSGTKRQPQRRLLPLDMPAWPMESRGVQGAADLSLVAPGPGDPARLDEWGVASVPVVGDDGEPVARLVTGSHASQLWMELALTFPQHGLWPVVTDAVEHGRSTFDGECEGPLPVEGDVLALLQDLVADLVADDDDPELREFLWRRELSRLAAPSPTVPHTYYAGSVRRRGGLLVVPAARPADVPARLGWLGATNHDLSGGEISLVLRSWEDRYGAVLMELGFDTMSLQVPAPPTDATQVELLAREHDAFCSDNIDQGFETLEAYLPAVTRLGWHFWWD